MRIAADTVRHRARADRSEDQGFRSVISVELFAPRSARSSEAHLPGLAPPVQKRGFRPELFRPHWGVDAEPSAWEKLRPSSIERSEERAAPNVSPPQITRRKMGHLRTVTVWREEFH